MEMTNLKYNRNMKKWIWMLVVILAQSTLVASAQRGQEKMSELRKNFVKEQLALTPDEEKQFWPLYDQYEAKLNDFRQAMKTAIDKAEAAPTNEKVVIESIDAVSKIRKDEADLDAKFFKDSMPIIGAERVGKLTRLEEEFRRTLMEKLKDKRGGGPGQHGPPPPPPHGGRPPHERE
jgi:hypothetical protein